MKMLNSKQYVAEILNNHRREALKENAVIVKEKKKEDEARKEKSDFYEEQIKLAALPGKYAKFTTRVKEELLEQCIYHVFNESLTVFDRYDEKQEAVKKALVKNFVQEQGVNKLLSKFKTKNVLLAEFAFIVNKAMEQVTETTDAKNLNSWTVDSDIKNRFIDDLEKCNSKEAIVTITDRVMDAETDFVNDNIRRKMEIDNIMKSKKEKLDMIEDKPEEVKESVAAGFDRKVKAIKNRHVSSIYQTIAESMTKNVLSDPDLKNIYIKEGNLDMDAVLVDAGIMYTFLETVYTTEMVDEEYITSFINNI